ncbi:hypothetical protein AS658_16340 [Serratia marcescens]|nr:hypothetical protein AM681_16500 [Serratia marcescens]AVU41218.1 hypothetical protein AS658_16340 [Serratia marcescens]
MIDIEKGRCHERKLIINDLFRYEVLIKFKVKLAYEISLKLNRTLICKINKTIIILAATAAIFLDKFIINRDQPCSSNVIVLDNHSALLLGI